MATVTSVATGDWSAGATWDTDPVIPVNGDTVIIANTHTVTFDVDMSGWANGVTLTINAGGTLDVKDDAGAYYLLTSADITMNGTWTCGTSTSVPFTGTFDVDFNGGSNSIVCGAAGVMQFYCTEPTNKYINLSGVEAAGQTILSVDTDVTADIWAATDQIIIADNNYGQDTEIRTIAGGGIAAGTITVTAGLTNQKESGAYVILVTRNIRLHNSTDYAIKSLVTATSHVDCEINGAYGVSNSQNHTMGGAIATTNLYTMQSCEAMTITAVCAGQNTSALIHNSQSTNTIYTAAALIAGFDYGPYQCRATVINCDIVGCGSAVYDSSNTKIYGDLLYNGTGVNLGTDILLANNTLDNTTNFNGVQNMVGYNVSLTGTDFANYNDATSRGQSDYAEIFEYDQTTNAYKAWALGGIVTSQTASPPTGYTIWYELAAEDDTQTYHAFRQYLTTVQPGTTLEVDGVIRNADNGDLTGYEPALQLIDRFADPLVDSTATVLDEDEIPDPDSASEAGWQNVSVLWANQGDAPRQVYVRMIAYHDGGVDDVDIDTAWSVADYQDQIASIYGKLPTNYIMGSSDVNDHDTDIDAILVDTGTTLPATLATAQSDLDIITGTNGVLIDDDAITASKFDETTAFPLASADSGSTEVARTGADGDTLETLSDQLDTVTANTGKVVNVYPTGTSRQITPGNIQGIEED